MEDRQAEVWKQYDMTVINRYRARGAVLLETDKGWKLFRELEGSVKHLDLEYTVKEILREKGFVDVDQIVKTLEGELYSQDAAGGKYILRDWFRFPECDLQNPEQLRMAAESLAALHGILEHASVNAVEGGRIQDIPQTFAKRTRELKRVYNYVRERTGKNSFEVCLLNSFREFYRQAGEAGEELAQSAYETMFRQAEGQGSICHGDFNQHHVLVGSHGGVVTNFEKCYVGLQIADLYQFLRKAMEKNHWDIEIGETILSVYDEKNPLRQEELEILAILLKFPEKFWKIANYYYNSRKSWISDHNMQKLMKICKQEEAKQKFLYRLTSFHTGKSSV